MTGSKPQLGPQPHPQTAFLNVDLLLQARYDLTPLTQAFEPDLFLLRLSEEDGVWIAILELAEGPEDLDTAISGFVRIVLALSEANRKLFAECEQKILDVGIQSGLAPYTEAFPLSFAAMSGMVQMGTQLVFTVYGASAEEEPDSGETAVEDR